MNYRHIYHAGSFSDIIKHSALVSILNKLNNKLQPYCVIDAFAGTGLYDLTSLKSIVTGEAASGISKLNILKLDANKQCLPELLQQYLNIIYSYNNQAINIYPGSPNIIENLLRPQDLLIACELQVADYAELRANFTGFSNVKTHHIDAYLAIKAFTPPKQARGLIFIDPPFEKTDEFDKLIMILKILKKRFLAAINLIWFPIKNRQTVQNFYNHFAAINFKEALLLEFSLCSQNDKLTTIGLLIINPPWQVAEELAKNINFLIKHSFKGASFTIKQLIN